MLSTNATNLLSVNMHLLPNVFPATCFANWHHEAPTANPNPFIRRAEAQVLVSKILEGERMNPIRINNQRRENVFPTAMLNRTLQVTTLQKQAW